MIKQADSNQVLVEWPATHGQAAREQMHAHPLRQAEDYKYALMDKLKEESILRNHEQGPDFGKLGFPMGRAVILTGINRPEIEQEDLLGPSLAPVFDQDSILFLDDVNEWQDLSDRNVIAHDSGIFLIAEPNFASRL